MLSKLKDFFARPPIKCVVMFLLTTSVSITLSFLGDWNYQQPHFGFKLTGFIVSTLLYGVALVSYTTIDVNQRRSSGILLQQNNTFEDLIISIISICETNAADVNTCIHRIQQTNHIDLGIWSFKKASRTICEHIYNNVCKLGNSKKYGIAYISLIEDGLENKVKMISFANQNRHRPSIYDIPRQFKDIAIASAYRDLQLFNSAKSDTDIYMGSDEVDKALVRNNGRRQLYLGIPVFCDNKKMIGLLEIVGYDNSMLGCLTRAELEEVANKFLVPYANIFLLLHKMEKALLAGTDAEKT